MTVRRLLTVGHSYVVALNRRLAHELARAGGDRWEVTAAAPQFVRGDLRPIALEPLAQEACRLQPVRAYLTRWPHFLSYGSRLRDIVRERWDLVHSWEEPYVFAGYQIAKWVRSDVPMVFWTAQNLPKRYPPPFNYFERTCLNRCSGWLACGHTTVSNLAQRGYGSKPHGVFPLGVDIDVFRPDKASGRNMRRSLGWSETGPPVVGYLGRFVPEKGVQLLTQSLDRLRSPWRALIVGGGPLESRLREWGKRFPDDRVRVVTGVPHNEVPAYVCAMGMLAAPSQTAPHWREQLGRMIIEAMASGVPVIGSDSGEIPYVIGDAGLVLPEAETAAWTDGMAKLLDSPKLQADLAARGLDRARSMFAWSCIARRHLQFFDQLLETHGRPSVALSDQLEQVSTECSEFELPVTDTIEPVSESKTRVPVHRD
jgi:glycosyltransferase involved in cell wall biosynthesis